MSGKKTNSARGVVTFTVLGAFLALGLASAQAADIDLNERLSFQETKDKWQRRSNPGPHPASFEVKTLKTFENTGPKLINPRPGDLLAYENTATGSHRARPKNEMNTTKSGQVVVIDVASKKVIASNQLPEDLRGSVHTTAVSPDGKWVYINGPDTPDGDNVLYTMVKVDALTLQPVKHLVIPARLHHGYVFQDKYMLMESFGGRLSPGGMGIYLYDPDTDTVVGGIKDDDLGGRAKHSYPGPEGKFIYSLITPTVLGRPSDLKAGSDHSAVTALRKGDLRWLPQTFWVGKIDPATWAVVREYPYPALRADWIQFSADAKSMYLNGSGDDKVVKMDLATGNLIWGAPVGTGPYGIEINAAETEVWIADKGETTSSTGRTITIVTAEKGAPVATLPSAYQADHIILSPDGKEMWVTSNGEGKIWVFNAASHELITKIDMPGYGQAHGLSFVFYGADGKGRTVADQGDFHFGVDPRNGRPLSLGYQAGG